MELSEYPRKADLNIRQRASIGSERKEEFWQADDHRVVQNEWAENVDESQMCCREKAQKKSSAEKWTVRWRHWGNAAGPLRKGVHDCSHHQAVKGQ
jgi:hypothetical protein